MAAIEYRAAVPSDSGAIRLCVARAYASALGAIADLPDVTSGIEQDITKHNVTVAEVDEQILGVIIFDEVSDAIMIFNLAVAPEGQGRGIARRLLEVAETTARDCSFSLLRLRTHKLMRDTRSIYRHLGWFEVAQTENSVLLEKPVARLVAEQ
ncbi:GNAT family N-acetyltransferase [Ruegeria arenilitoris]|uniref:GNAT family N-acetyltransferase n=1 Tax=Ruegeria arenilitoris TaxID=1173585 RepID=UPI00147CD744|nr:GNAT family N-acetyltransferase [Ruegeria arenilitoris]